MSIKNKALFDVATNLVTNDGKYTAKIQVPQYEPSNKKPHISELYDIQKYSKLMADINKADIPDDDKKFLKFAASRHIVFNYSKIADYYAHSDKDVQKLMEDSALVIIDIDDAIANGYVKLSKRVADIIGMSGDDNEE